MADRFHFLVHFADMNDASILYWDLKGTLAAGFVLLAWLVASGILLFVVPSEAIGWWASGAIVLQTWLSTGLFITAHDAMHGTISPHYPRLNHAFGVLALGLYALLPYRRLRLNHQRHHADPMAAQDPDFHKPGHAAFWRWYVDFIVYYVRWPQLIGMAVAFNILHHFAGVELSNLLVFWVMPALLSTLQLFYFGTYLPHRGAHAADDIHRARSIAMPRWASLLSCYHFGGYHREHHVDPSCPWWFLPSGAATELDDAQAL